MDIIRVADCTSTMDEARRAGDGTVVVAAQMSGGRGREGRPWHAPLGGWYASFVFEMADPRLLSLAVGNAVADMLEVAGVEPKLKWVNDVLVDGRKIAGVLVEAETQGDRTVCIVGVGINLNGSTKDWPNGLADVAITLQDALGVESCIEDTEPFFVDAILAAVEDLRAGRGRFLEAVRKRDALHGTKVTVEHRGETVTGVAAGIDDDGALLVDTGRGVERFLDGTVLV